MALLAHLRELWEVVGRGMEWAGWHGAAALSFVGSSTGWGVMLAKHLRRRS